MVSPTPAVDASHRMPGAASLHVPGNGPALPLLLVENGEPAEAAPTALPHRDFSGHAADPWMGSGSMMAVTTRRGEETWRTKSTGDTGCSAVEVTLGRLFRLTGLTAPEMALARNVDLLPPGELHVASRFDDRYQDLGQFLTTDVAERVVAGDDAARAERYRELRARHACAVDACERVLQRAGVERFWQLQRPDLVTEHARQDQARFEALEAMNRMLPVALRCEQLRHYVASAWLDNWDHLNYRMENTGFTVRDGQPHAMTVDFGSCGPLGFRNLRNGALLPKAASGDIAMIQRPAALFPIPEAHLHHADLLDTGGDDPGALQDTLRWPYGFQSESIVEMLRPPVAADPAVADTLAEMGYRLALLPRAAIDATVQQGWQAPEARSTTLWPDADAFVRQLDARRNTLLERHDAATLAHWVNENPERAAQVREEMCEAVRQAFGAGGAAAPCITELEHRHCAVSDGVLPGTAPAHAAVNGLTRELRSLQLLHDCCQRLQAAQLGGDPARITAIAEELLSPSLFGQLLLNLEMGPGAQVRSRAAFEANHAWMILIDRLVQNGSLNAQRVANCLLEPFEGSAYPPNVGAHAGRDPVLGMAFIGLLETLMAASTDLTPTQLRERLLAAKTRGYPNFYSALAASGASVQWDGVLQNAGLMPTTTEYIRLRSLWSLAVMKVNHASRRGDEPVVVPARQQAVAGMDLGGILDHLRSTCGPQRIADMELTLLREKVYSTMKLTSAEEDKAIRDVVEQAVSDAWKKALTRHRLPSSIPAPTDLVRKQQDSALADYRKTMRELRRADAEALIVQGEARYVQAVLEDPQLSIADRRGQLAQRAEAISTGIRAMVRSAAGVEGPPSAGSDLDAAAHGHLEAAVGQAALQVVAAVQASAQANARQQAAEQARERASRSAQSHATQQARRAVPAALAAGIATHAQAEAAKAAKQRATEKARQEAATRAARDTAVSNSVANAEIATRLALLKAPDAPGASSSTSRVTDDQITARLRNLRLPDASPAAASRRGPAVRQREAEYLDPKSGRPMTRVKDH